MFVTRFYTALLPCVVYAERGVLLSNKKFILGGFFEPLKEIAGSFASVSKLFHTYSFFW
jgi:hypothetical protein